MVIWFVPLITKSLVVGASLVKTLDVLLKGHSMIPKLNKSSWIRMNVGGEEFLTTKQTLLTTNSIFRLILRENPWDKYPRYKWNYWTTRFKYRKLPRGPQLDMKAYHQVRMKEDNLYYLDRDPNHFCVVLNYMRHKKLILPEDIDVQGVMEEARYLQVTELVNLLEGMGLDVPELPKQEALYEDVSPSKE